MGFWSFLTEMARRDASATAILGISICAMLLLAFIYGLSIWSSKQTDIASSIVEAIKAILLVAVGYFTGKSIPTNKGSQGQSDEK